MAIATGDQILAADVLAALAAVVVKIRKTADEAVTNSTVLQNDDHLVLPVGANEVWEFTLLLLCVEDAPGVSAVLKHLFTIPAAGALYRVPLFAAAIQNSEEVYGTVQVTMSGTIIVSVPYMYYARYIYVGGANAGNVQLQWAQRVAPGAGVKTTLLTNSCILAHKLA